MPRTADFHDQIADARLAETAGVVDDATALDATVDRRDAHAAAGDASLRGFVCARQGPAPRRLRRHEHLAVVERARQEAAVLAQPAPRGSRVGRRLGHPLLVWAAGVGVPPNEARERGVDQEHMLPRVARFLAAITARRRSRGLGGREAPCGAIVANRGKMGPAVGAAVGGAAGVGGPSVGTTIAVASAAATPRRCASSATARVGASPSTRRVAGRRTNRT
jgi:hypothetical protein